LGRLSGHPVVHPTWDERALPYVTRILRHNPRSSPSWQKKMARARAFLTSPVFKPACVRRRRRDHAATNAHSASKRRPRERQGHAELHGFLLGLNRVVAEGWRRRGLGTTLLTAAIWW